MAGNRHHILPRFLQKGFASKISGQEVFIWAYRRDGKVFEQNTKNVSVQRHFYGKEELSVDDEITEIEKEFAVMLDELRLKKNGYKILNQKIADFVGHLSIRTKHLRDSLIEGTDLLSTTIFGYLSNENNFRNWLLEYYKRHPEVVRNAVDEALVKLQIPKNQRLILRQRLLAVIRPKHLLSQINTEISSYTFLFATLAATLSEKLPNMLKEQHIKLLAKNLIPEPSVDEYRKLNWFVCKSDTPLIIGDVGCLFEVSDKKRFVSLGGKTDKLQNVFLPISSDTLILGTKSSEMPQINFDLINETFIKCSREFFLYKEYSSDLETRLNMLGVDSEILGEEEAQILLKEVIEEL